MICDIIILIASCTKCHVLYCGPEPCHSRPVLFMKYEGRYAPYLPMVTQRRDSQNHCLKNMVRIGYHWYHWVEKCLLNAPTFDFHLRTSAQRLASCFEHLSTRAPFRDAGFFWFDQTKVPCRTCWTSWPRRAAPYSTSPMFLKPVQAPWGSWCLKHRQTRNSRIKKKKACSVDLTIYDDGRY